jgi:hypothetical protein
MSADYHGIQTRKLVDVARIVTFRVKPITVRQSVFIVATAASSRCKFSGSEVFPYL